MGKKHKRYSREFKRQVVALMKTSTNVPRLAQELHLYKNQLYKWRREVEGRLEDGEPGVESEAVPGSKSAVGIENSKLKTALAEKVLELDFFRSALRRVEASRRSQISGGPAFMPKSGPERSSKAD
jgi:transposase-like protein